MKILSIVFSLLILVSCSHQISREISSKKLQRVESLDEAKKLINGNTSTSFAYVKTDNSEIEIHKNLHNDNRISVVDFLGEFIFVNEPLKENNIEYANNYCNLILPGSTIPSKMDLNIFFTPIEFKSDLVSLGVANNSAKYIISDTTTVNEYAVGVYNYGERRFDFIEPFFGTELGLICVKK